MKRLFQVNTPAGKLARREDGSAYYAEGKQEAKLYRDSLNQKLPGGFSYREGHAYTVANGPDHWRACK